jgi:hypothetical protein
MVLELIEFLGHTVEAGLGWRYLLSRRYRQQVHARWKTSSGAEKVGDVLTISLSFIFINLIIGGLIWWGISGS